MQKEGRTARCRERKKEGTSDQKADEKRPLVDDIASHQHLELAWIEVLSMLIPGWCDLELASTSPCEPSLCLDSECGCLTSFFVS